VPKVSVIIPIYNTERYLAQCLDSVVAQTLEDIEIICVDDGSTDGSATILREYAQRDERVVVVHQQNQGLSAARNAGLDVASGDFIQFLDSDDWAEPTLLEDAYTRCVDDQAEMCIVRFRYVREDTGVTLDADCSLRMNLIPEKRPFSRADVSGGLFELSTPAAWNKMLSRSFVAHKGLRFSGGAFDIEDVPFTYMALIQAERITVVDKVLVNYRTGVAGSLMANVHERPTAICQALLLVKDGAKSLGVFDEIERDFVSTALDQCLYHLKIAKTVEAFQTLYEALKQTYFAELGIDGLARDDHPDQLQYDRYVRIQSMPAESYLFAETAGLRIDLATRLEQYGALRITLEQRTEQLGNLRADLAARSAEIKDLRADLAARSAEIKDLRADLAARSAACESLERKLKKTSSELAAANASLAKADAKLTRIEHSRSYRMARRLARIVSRIRHPLASSRKAR